MNDKDIIIALECCGCGCCTSCPYGDKGDNCDSVLLEDVFALIKRQQAEIERLKEELANPVVAYTDLPISNEKLLRIDHKKEIVKAIRAETIKEFAERLKSESYYICGSICKAIYVDEIETLVKEMLGKEDE